MGWVNLSLVFLTALFVTGLLVRFAFRFGLVAVPGEHRQHTAPTPMVGGLGVFAGLALGVLCWSPADLGLLSCLAILCLVGMLDDRITLPSWLRLLVQGGVAYLMIKLTGVRLESLGFLVSTKYEVVLGPWSMPMTIFAVIGVINATNMSDGMDGLAGSLVIISLGVLLLLTKTDVTLIWIAIASVSGFLVLNLRIGRARAKVFMGDAGSTMIGLLLAYLLINASQQSAGFPPVVALWVLALPLIDAVSVLIVRPLRGRSPFDADRVHYHHLILDRGLSVNQTLILVVVVQTVCGGFGAWMFKTGVADNHILLVFLIMFILYLVALYQYTGRKA
ncbi:undecaprenyl-phosphate alpha-N-acetylglucosaminyl 1-phosphate transferase [Arenicella chitinivorans]|uniref:Undecaprenyl-phosphate alpha-N-acetylglucosaminyl 1-phosphate transferase n=1 Tax=Arenicella chitinivorans TaxID=1329800 RepID=A0A918VLM5_9GAMM|nr:undecaprenyl-phosphate alpha-N-acetylglucosaminyl 1-phosphate transferase [Arenicella chitinivorans]GHA08447.1 undecaprenyl-phosphate alpha-N-acetylglucosaminyl 1-phosphate transferase [Arenicella chitinivorans]